MGATEQFLIDPKNVRKRLAMNQQDFWGRIGVAQSAGSRYESGRRMPKPVQELLRVVHLERIDLSRVRARDMAILDYMKVCEPGFYLRLSEAVASAVPQSTFTHIRSIQPVPKPERPAMGNAVGRVARSGTPDGAGSNSAVSFERASK